MGAATLAISIGCAPETPNRPSAPDAPRPPDRATSSLLLVTLDTFRADAAGCGGAPAARTPWLDRVGRTGIQFERGVVSSPLTLPSHATMLTGRFPPDHGVRSNGTYRLEADVPSLAPILKERGFATGAFLAAFALDGKFGLDRGFDVYDDRVGTFEGRGAFEMARRPGDVVVDAAREWAEALATGTRRFEWVHLFDAHRPHDAAAAWRAATGDLYLAETAETDAHFGRRLRAREAEGDRAWVVVLGDHGESEGDHGEETHGLFIYDATMRVPAMIWPAPPGETPGLRRATFRAVDLAATAFDLLGLPPDDAPGDGRTALSREATEPNYLETLYPYLHHGWAELRAIDDGRWKYVRAPEPELYDRVADPGEIDNVYDEWPDIVARLEKTLALQTTAERQGSHVELDAKSREALESLGYVTETADAGPDDERPDPKRMVRVNRLLMAAMNAWGAGSLEGARRELGQALALDPKNKEITKTMGMLHAARGNDALAADWFRRSLELPPDNRDPFARVELALAVLRLGRAKEAVQHLEMAIELDDQDASIWNNLGAARAGAGNLEGAREAWRRSLAVDPEFEAARSSLERSSRQR